WKATTCRPASPLTTKNTRWPVQNHPEQKKASPVSGTCLTPNPT
ncbi:MAG: hypothetical protein AVDCRST_MAG56-3107, partial [uncultured Cytophagales bacterium]